MEESIVVREENEKKRRKLKSKVWDEFTKSKPGEDGKQWAICNHCGGKFDGCSKKGTTHLKNHLVSKICQDKRNGRDEDKSTKTRDKSATPVVMEETSSMIDLIKQSFDEDGCPIEHWDPSVFNSRKDEILQAYQEEKKKLGEFISKLSCHFSLSIERLCFRNLVLRVHYIDDSWERQSKVISILPYDYEKWIEETKELCSELKIDRNIYCIILPEWLMEDVDDDSWFSQRGSLPFAGFALDFEGFIHKIHRFTRNWEVIKIDGLRECVDYIYNKTSSSTKLILQRHTGKNVNLNNPHNTWLYDDFECLEVAVGLKEVFSELEKINPDFISINLTNQQWDEATATFQHLQALEKFIQSFYLDHNSTTDNIVVDILKLFRFHRSEDCRLCRDASYKKLFDNFQVYSVIMILDPRFKMDKIQLWYEEIYDRDADGYFEKTIKYFRDIYNEYAKDSKDDYKMMDDMGRPSTSSTKSELDLYLHDLKVPAVQEFDILAWWHGNALFYPTLARMARDYSAIPMQRININSPMISKSYFIGRASEIDDDIKSTLIYLRGLPYD